MAQVIRISALLLGSALLMLAGGLHGMILPLRGAAEGFSLLALGLIGTGWSVGFILGSLLVPHLVRSVGHIRSYSVMAAIACMTILFNLVFIDSGAWIVLRVFSGFCFAGAAMVVESWLNEVADNRSRGTTFSVYSSVILFASTAGQLSLSITGYLGYLPFVFAAIAYIAAVLPTAVTRSPQPQPLNRTTLDLGLLISTSPIAVAASFAIGMANGAFGTLAPVYGLQRGFDTSTIASFMGLSALVGAIAQIPLGRLSDSIDRRIVMIGVALVGLVAAILMMIVQPAPGIWLLSIMGMFGFAAFSLYAIAVAHANDYVTEGGFAKVASGMLLVYGAGTMLGPIMASMLMQWLGSWALFIIPGLFHGLLALLAFLRMRVRARAPDAERAPFRFIPSLRGATSQTVVLDPRTTDTEALEADAEKSAA